jgi:endonuclease YncB( thermonuclease family)
MAKHLFRLFVWPVIAVISLMATPVHAWEISSYAFVNENGTLRIEGETIHLYGIHIPETGRHCRTNTRPVICGSRAYLALEFKIQGFVHCEIRDRNHDGSVVGHCRVNVSNFDEGTDLSAYLLKRGWAAALPNAPVRYHTLEKIASRRGMGVWGFPVDSIIRRTR